jgi:hypothetical protein
VRGWHTATVQIRVRPGAAVAAVLLLAGCASGTPSSKPDAATRQVLQKFAAARTPAEMCMLLSSAFRFFIGNGDPSLTACVTNYSRMTGPLVPGRLQIGSVTLKDGQQVARVTVGDRPTTLYLVHQYGSEKVNSVNIREGIGPSPPPYSVYSH